MQPALNFYIQNISFTDSLGNYDIMDVVVHDVNDNDTVDFLKIDFSSVPLPGIDGEQQLLL